MSKVQQAVDSNNLGIRKWYDGFRTKLVFGYRIRIIPPEGKKKMDETWAQLANKGKLKFYIADKKSNMASAMVSSYPEAVDLAVAAGRMQPSVAKKAKANYYSVVVGDATAKVVTKKAKAKRVGKAKATKVKANTGNGVTTKAVQVPATAKVTLGDDLNISDTMRQQANDLTTRAKTLLKQAEILNNAADQLVEA